MNRVHIRWDRRPKRPAAEALRDVISGCLEQLGTDHAEVHLVLTGDETLRELNLRFRDIDRATDVLSFPDGDELPSGRIFLGEVAIQQLHDCERQPKVAGVRGRPRLTVRHTCPVWCSIGLSSTGTERRSVPKDNPRTLGTGCRCSPPRWSRPCRSLRNPHRGRSRTR